MSKKTTKKNNLNPYIVATNTNITCVCMAKSKADAVKRCKHQYIEAFDELHPEIWTAYRLERFFLDTDEYYRKLNEDVLLLQSAY